MGNFFIHNLRFEERFKNKQTGFQCFKKSKINRFFSCAKITQHIELGNLEPKFFLTLTKHRRNGTIMRYHCSMKTAFSLIFALVFSFGFAQSNGTTLTFKEFGWTISIPSGYKKMQTDQPDMILAYEKDASNNIQAYWEDFEEPKDGNYVESLRAAKKAVTEAANEQLPGSSTTTETSETISGKKFAVFTSKVVLDENTKAYTVTLARTFKKKGVSINLTYFDESEGKKMMDAVRKSVFK